MSLTMAWNNPPSAPHSFSTDSMVSKTNKTRPQRDENQMKYPTVDAFSNIRNGDLGFVHPPFLILCYDNDKAKSAAGEDAKPRSPQPEACGAHRQKEMCCSMAAGAAARPAAAAATRLLDAREGWSRDALWLGKLKPGNVEGTCTVAPDRRVNTNNREFTIVGWRTGVGGEVGERGGGGTTVTGLGRGDALRCWWRSRCLRAGVSRNMIHGNGKGLFKFFFFLHS